LRYMPSKNKANAVSSLYGITRRLAFEGEDGEFVKSIYLHTVWKGMCMWYVGQWNVTLFVLFIYLFICRN
jgi:hypothetical protein